jgi:adenylate kinase
MNFDSIFLAGPQGSGKGTQGNILAKKTGFFFWDMGNILRAITAEQTPLAEKLQVINKGTLLSDEVLIEVLKEKLPGVPHGRGIIFDGVPRRLGQAEFLVSYLREQGRNRIATLFIDLPREESIRRLLLRAEHESRVDDTPEGIETRFRFYDEAMQPTVAYLKKETSFITVDGSGMVENVTQNIDAALGIN